MKIILKLLRYIAAFLLLIIAFLLLLQGVTPIYDFEEPNEFSGEYLYNPYQNLDSLDYADNFRKANLHAHQSLEGMPFENMYNYKDGEFEGLYRDLGYDLALISDHQYINPLSPARVYEHGINIANYHINCLGAEKVSWIDLPVMLYQRSQMQWMMDHLREKGVELLSLNHPSRFRGGFKYNKINTLTGYDLIEMDDQAGGDDSPWDYALSSGHYPMLSATDDSHFPMAHDGRMGHRYTMVALGNDLSERNLFRAMKQGESYGVQVIGGGARGKGTEPKLESFNLTKDTLSVEMAQEVDSVLFIGQGGEIKKVVKGDNIAWYKFQPEDTYIRTEVYLPTSMMVWLNPVVRTKIENTAPASQKLHTINWWLTILNSVMWLIVALTIGRWAIKLLFRRGKRDGRFAPGSYYYERKRR